MELSTSVIGHCRPISWNLFILFFLLCFLVIFVSNFSISFPFFSVPFNFVQFSLCCSVLFVLVDFD